MRRQKSRRLITHKLLRLGASTVSAEPSISGTISKEKRFRRAIVKLPCDMFGPFDFCQMWNGILQTVRAVHGSSTFAKLCLQSVPHRRWSVVTPSDFGKLQSFFVKFQTLPKNTQHLWKKLRTAPESYWEIPNSFVMFRELQISSENHREVSKTAEKFPRSDGKLVELLGSPQNFWEALSIYRKFRKLQGITKNVLEVVRTAVYSRNLKALKSFERLWTLLRSF